MLLIVTVFSARFTRLLADIQRIRASSAPSACCHLVNSITLSDIMQAAVTRNNKSSPK